jgi:hypothetical protein
MNAFLNWSLSMPVPSHGITADVIRQIMPEYYLSDDLVRAALDALPPPPPDASVAWRRARVARYVQDIIGFHPADTAQAGLAVQVLINREMAGNLARRSYAPELTVEQMSRLCRTSTELSRTAVLVERLLTRRQDDPARFFGSVAADGIDLDALEAGWGNGRRQAPPADGGVPEGDGAFAQADMVPGGVGPDGDGPDGDGPAGDGPAGDGPAGNGPAGNGPAGNDQDGNDQEGDGPGGDGDAASDDDLAAAGVSALDGGSDLESVSGCEPAAAARTDPAAPPVPGWMVGALRAALDAAAAPPVVDAGTGSAPGAEK